MFVNAAILILAGAVFFVHHQDVTEISQAYLLLAPLMGTVVASKLFGIALFCFGAIFHADRNHGRADRDGRLPQHPRAAVAAAPGDAAAGHRSGVSS